MSAPNTIPPGKSFPDFASTPPSSLWSRISTWASENKAVVYTVAGVAIIVTGAGVAYYLTDSVSIIISYQWMSRADLNIEGYHSRSRFAEEIK
jgi:import receptor subunit TOM70